MTAEPEEKAKPPPLLRNHFEGCVRVARGIACGCLDPNRRRELGQRGTELHVQPQDEQCAAWKRLLELVESAAADGRQVFAPAQDLGPESWAQIVTLPSTISKLKRVKHLQLYGSNLVRIPPEIGDMENLACFTPYTSYSLHWFPYEITRCQQLMDSTVSTRASYGNYKNGLPFPKLPSPAETVRPLVCSVCRGPLGRHGPTQRWITLRVATDDLPLLVNACGRKCVKALPPPRHGYMPRPHRGSC